VRRKPPSTQHSVRKGQANRRSSGRDIGGRGLRKPSPGRAAIHGGAKVARFTSVARRSTTIFFQESPLTAPQTSP
jgi:hypothetical protein